MVSFFSTLYTFSEEELKESNPRISLNSTSLIISSARKTDSGKYFCVVKSIIGDDISEEASAKVDVLGINL